MLAMGDACYLGNPKLMTNATATQQMRGEIK